MKKKQQQQFANPKRWKDGTRWNLYCNIKF